MAVIHAREAETHEMHGSKFVSYARPASGTRELCGWLIEIPGGTAGVAHRVTREEMLYVMAGSLHIHLDDEHDVAVAGDAVVVPAGAQLQLDNQGAESAAAWVTTSVGFAGILAGSTWIRPPWVS